MTNRVEQGDWLVEAIDDSEPALTRFRHWPPPNPPAGKRDRRAGHMLVRSGGGNDNEAGRARREFNALGLAVGSNVAVSATIGALSANLLALAKRDL